MQSWFYEKSSDRPSSKPDNLLFFYWRSPTNHIFASTVTLVIL
ncbi:MAG: hypothetical protein WBB82_15175 [Limnothrix sp.]